MLKEIMTDMSLVRDPKKRRSFENKLFKDAHTFIGERLPEFQFHWQLQISKLLTETVVESICSKIRAVYHANRRKMSYKTLQKLLQVMIMLPDDDAIRSKIVDRIAKKYYELYGDTIIRNECYKKHRRKKEQSNVLVRKYAGKDSVFTTDQWVLDEFS